MEKDTEKERYRLTRGKGMVERNYRLEPPGSLSHAPFILSKH